MTPRSVREGVRALAASRAATVVTGLPWRLRGPNPSVGRLLTLRGLESELEVDAARHDVA